MVSKIDIRKQWKYKGRQCVILWVESHFCAYVETKLEDVYYGQEFGCYGTSPESCVEAHGGLTFSGELHKELGYGKTNFFGCDYAHCGDYREGSAICGDGKKWTLKEVEKETKQMADSIIKYEKVHGKYKKAFESFKKEVEKIQEKKQ